MLLSYKFYTFSQPFSQLPNKFYGRKFQNIHLTQPKIKIKTYFIHKLGERRKKEWEIEGKRDRLGKRGSKWMEAAVAKSAISGGSQIGQCVGEPGGARPAVDCQDWSLTCTRRCMAVNRRGGSWVFVDRWWGRGGVDLCLIGDERHGLDGGRVDLKFRWLASLSL